MFSMLDCFVVCVVLLSNPSPISSVSISVLPVGTMWATILDLTIKLSMIGGAFWAVWGVIVLAGGLKDKNGPALQSGIWQIIGGIMIIAASAAFAQIAVIS